MLPLPPRVTSPSHWLQGPTYYARREPLRWIPEWFKAYGDLYRITSPLGQATIVGAPALAQQVLIDRYTRYQEKSRAYAVLRILMGNGLVTSAGDFWRGQRKLVQPAFHRRRLEALGGMMIERVAEMVARLALAARTGEPVDLAPILSQVTLEVIARAMFSSDVHGQAADVARHIAALNEFALHLLRNPWLFLVPRRFPTPFTRREYDSLQALNRIVNDIIQSRRRNPG